MHIAAKFRDRHLHCRPCTDVMRDSRHIVPIGPQEEQEDDFEPEQLHLQRSVHKHRLQPHELN